MALLILTGVAALALLLWLALQRSRPRRIVSHDERVLRSKRLRLVGRPDRILRLEDGTLIPVEKKSGRTVQDSHRAQLGVYLLLIEEETGRRPPYGVIVLDGDVEHRIETTDALLGWTSTLIEGVRAVRAAPNAPCGATPFPAKCRGCSVNASCGFSQA